MDELAADGGLGLDVIPLLGDLDELDMNIDIAKHVLKLGAAVLLQWPLLEFRGYERVPPPLSAPKLVLANFWIRFGTGFEFGVLLFAIGVAPWRDE